MEDRFQFRAWDGKKMVGVGAMKHYPTMTPEWALYNYCGVNIGDDAILMQSTGLQNFYEGDILHTHHGNGQITWDEHGLRWLVIFSDNDIESLYKVWSSGTHEPCEIIGNIHENPELLKAQSEAP